MDINRQRRRHYRTNQSQRRNLNQTRRRRQTNADEEQVLTDATERGDTETVRQWIQVGVNVNCVKDKTTTPLLEACKHGFDEIVRILLHAGAFAR